VGFQFLQVSGGADHEHAAVPEVVAALDVVGRSDSVWLFGESGDLPGVRGQRFSLADIAVAGFRSVRYYAKGDQFALRCQ